MKFDQGFQVKIYILAINVLNVKNQLISKDKIKQNHVPKLRVIRKDKINYSLGGIQ